MIASSALSNVFGSEADVFDEWLLHHVANTDYWSLPFGKIDLRKSQFLFYGIDMTVSLHVVMLFLGALLCMVLFPLSSRRKNLLPVSKFGHAVEALAVFVRNDMVYPFLGRQNASFWTPHILSIFFFLLVLNLLGLIPYLGTVTSNINFTAAMAAMVFLTFNITGILHNGLSYFKNLAPSGVPGPILVILYPIEVVALFTKTCALAIRMFANMSAGHFLIFSLLGLIHVFHYILESKAIALGLVAPISIVFALFIWIIEILVAFIQAYVFTLLTTLFIGSAVHQDH